MSSKAFGNRSFRKCFAEDRSRNLAHLPKLGIAGGIGHAEDYKQRPLSQNFSDPGFNRLAQFPQSSREEVIGSFNDDQLLRFRNRRDQRFQLVARTELVTRSADEQLRLGAAIQEAKCINARLFFIGCYWGHGSSNANHRFDARIGVCGPQSHCGTKRESSENYWHMKFAVEPIQRRPNVVNFPNTMIVLSLAQSGSPKIEAQDRKTKAVQRFHGMKHNLVVQRAPEQWMRMTDHCRMRRVARSRVEESLKAPCRAAEEERTD